MWRLSVTAVTVEWWRGKRNNRVLALDCSREDFILFRRILVRIPGVTALEGRGAMKPSWSFRDNVLKAQEQRKVCRKVQQGLV